MDSNDGGSLESGLGRKGLGTAAIAKKHGWHMFLCEQLLPLVKLGKARVLAKSRPAIQGHTCGQLLAPESMGHFAVKF